MVLYPILLSQSWPTTVPNFMLVSGIAQSGQNLALSRLANIYGIYLEKQIREVVNATISKGAVKEERRKL